MSFLIVFTVFRTAVNSDFIYSSTVSSWLLSCLSSPGWNQQRTLPIFFVDGMPSNRLRCIHGPLSLLIPVTQTTAVLFSLQRGAAIFL